ncbi:SAM-dependent methyltransferase [Usitatibacter palustris]|uniref:Tuberculostearic acid methyltransferase UfaA1 n=1 Tax=Usitatibacter palustris TaxID=2732487 RepID=A0A6M4H2G0_9PROT|nr:cyclopropane-fatty-acyl-phospholipid synthase family protein [Usitatibacter palustris]QJR13731.1 Tuberculostearic acid methyltransferase UfaA1 [Usitatibacter palustris]
MNTTAIEPPGSTARAGALDALARRLVIGRLEALRRGGVYLSEGHEDHAFGTPGAGLQASLTVLDPAFYSEIAFGGSVGAGESYMLGHWKANDLTTLLRLMLRNRDVMEGLETGVARLTDPLRRVAHWMHRNTRAGSRRNIAAHYDLGNDFFELFLDETLMYSCALFTRPQMSLAEASVAKLDAVCAKLDLGPADHVLEIGTGWGGFALHAASRYGCRVTTTTISPSQYERACERVREAGLSDRITVLLEDYRDLGGRYSKLVSIEMIEAIGHDHFEEYFRCAAARLAPGGRMLLQSITIADHHYRRARGEVDFIKRHIFPGCCIPSVSALAQAMAEASDLRIVHLEDIGPHYATTLACWRENFLARLEEVRALGYPETFIRMWEFYLCYCEAGFAERALGNAQMVLARDFLS